MVRYIENLLEYFAVYVFYSVGILLRCPIDIELNRHYPQMFLTFIKHTCNHCNLTNVTKHLKK